MFSSILGEVKTGFFRVLVFFFFLSLCFESSPKDMGVDFRERRRERERDTDAGEKHPSAASPPRPSQGLNLRPRRVT